MSGTYTCETCGYQSSDVGDYLFKDDGTISVCTSCMIPVPVNLCTHEGALVLRQHEEYIYDDVSLILGTLHVNGSDNMQVGVEYRKLRCRRCDATIPIPKREEWA